MLLFRPSFPAAVERMLRGETFPDSKTATSLAQALSGVNVVRYFAKKGLTASNRSFA